MNNNLARIQYEYANTIFIIIKLKFLIIPIITVWFNDFVSFFTMNKLYNLQMNILYISCIQH